MGERDEAFISIQLNNCKGGISWVTFVMTIQNTIKLYGVVIYYEYIYIFIAASGSANQVCQTRGDTEVAMRHYIFGRFRNKLS